jgi:hypothetical protein
VNRSEIKIPPTGGRKLLFFVEPTKNRRHSRIWNSVVFRPVVSEDWKFFFSDDHVCHRICWFSLVRIWFLRVWTEFFRFSDRIGSWLVFQVFTVFLRNGSETGFHWTGWLFLGFGVGFLGF